MVVKSLRWPPAAFHYPARGYTRGNLYWHNHNIQQFPHVEIKCGMMFDKRLEYDWAEKEMLQLRLFCHYTLFISVSIRKEIYEWDKGIWKVGRATDTGIENNWCRKIVAVRLAWHYTLHTAASKRKESISTEVKNMIGLFKLLIKG